VDFPHQMDTALVAAEFVLPAWLVWRLPRYYLSLPLGTLVYWALVVNHGRAKHRP